MKTIDTDVKQIIKHIAQGDIDAAQETYMLALRHGIEEHDLVVALARANPVPPGTIVAGPSLIVYANPFRADDYAARCGNCRTAFPGWPTPESVRRRAEKHAGEHPGIRVRWITQPTGA